MINSVNVILASVFLLLVVQSEKTFSSENLLEASVSARTEYNDNIFLTTSPHDAVSSLIVTPSLSGIIKEQNWEVKLNSQLRVNRYSDHDLDSNGQLFDLTGQYSAERNILSINVGHELISSLSSSSTDFGISTVQVDRKTQDVSPQYTRLLTERLVSTLSYTYSDTDYKNNGDARFVASYTETASVALRYNLTEKDQISINLQATDYTRKDRLGDIQIFNINFGLDHKFSDTLSVDLAVGTSKRNSTNLQTTVLDFFGTTILIPQEIDIETSGNTFSLGISQMLETGSVGARASRSTTTNSFGGLDESDNYEINYGEKMSPLWRYSILANFENTTSVSTATRSTDREVIFLEARTYYSLTQDWNMSLSYRYSQRKFKSISSAGDIPDSHRLQIGLTYNLPRLSTF